MHIDEINNKKQQEAKTSNSISDFKKKISQKYKDFHIADTLYFKIQLDLDYIADELWNVLNNSDYEVDITGKRDSILEVQALVECLHNIFVKNHLELIYLLKDGVEDNNGDDPIPENISKLYPSLN